MRNIMCVAVVYISNVLYGADSNLSPRERIIKSAKEQNMEKIKIHAQDIMQISDADKERYNIKHLYSFNDSGNKCLHIVAFYPKKNTLLDSGIDNDSKRVLNSGANVFQHSIKDEKIHSEDVIKKEDFAPNFFENINLSNLPDGRLYSLMPSRIGIGVTQIKEKNSM